MAPTGPLMQTAHSLGYGQGQAQWFEMGWSTKPRYETALVGNWFEESPTAAIAPKVLPLWFSAVCNT